MEREMIQNKRMRFYKYLRSIAEYLRSIYGVNISIFSGMTDKENAGENEDKYEICQSIIFIGYE